MSVALSLNSLNSLISLNSLSHALSLLFPLYFCSFGRLLSLYIVPKVEKIGIYTTEPFGILFVTLQRLLHY